MGTRCAACSRHAFDSTSRRAALIWHRVNANGNSPDRPNRGRALWTTAREIPGVHVFEDRGAKVAQSFGAFTSGQTLLYNRDGHLLFKGGITAFRGHSGDNAGRIAILALLQHETPRTSIVPVVTPVLGCSLRGEE